MSDCEQTNMEILEEWIAGRGKQPVTWSTLIEVLHDVELSTLAGEIAAIKIPEGECLEAMLLECGDSDANSEGSVGEDSDQSDGEETPAEQITDVELSTLATEIEAVKLPLEDRPTENHRTVSDVCTGVGEDSDQSDGEIPAELIELSTLATEFEAVKLLLEDRPTEDTKYSNQITVSDVCTGVGEDSDQSDGGEIPAELIEDFRRENSEAIFQECEDSEQKEERHLAYCKGSELIGDVEATKSDLLTRSQDSEQEQEDEADSVSCDIDRTGNSFIEDDCLD